MNIERRIQLYEQRLQQMQLQMDRMRLELDTLKELTNTDQINNNPVSEKMEMKPEVTDHEQVILNVNQGLVYPYIKTRSPVLDQDNRSYFKNLESHMGKYMMGILASILIFISLVSFVSLVYVHLTDDVKMIAIYAGSILILSAGYIGSKKKKSVFYLSVLGCGVGALYLSLFLTNVYFRRINEVVLYVLLFIWACLVYVLSKKRSVIFQTIGQIGVLISVLFGVSYCKNMMIDNQDYRITLCFSLLLFFSIISIFYNETIRRKGFRWNIMSLSIMLVSLLPFLYVYGVVFTRYASLPFILLFAGIMFADIIYLLLCFLSRISVENDMECVSYCVFSLVAIAACLLIIAMSVLEFPWNESTKLVGVCVAGIVTAIFWIFEEKWVKNKQYKIGLGVEYFVICLFLCDLNPTITNTVGTLLVAIPLILIAMVYNRQFYFLLGCIATGIYAVTGQDTNLVLHIPFVIASIGCIGVIMWLKKEYYNTLGKVILYCALMLGLVRDLSALARETQFNTAFMYVILAILNLIASKSKFIYNWTDSSKEEKETLIVTGVFNGLLLLEGLSLIGDKNILVNCLVILVTAVLCASNAMRLMEMCEKKIWIGFYNAIKITTFILITIHSFGAQHALLSICSLILAIISISLGFVLQYKSLRLYGLLLSILSICKLILVDLTYDNSIERAVSFLVCGLLCFSINLIYNKAKNASS